MFRKYIYLTGAFIFGCCCPSSQEEFPVISECKLEEESFLKLEGVQVRDCFTPNIDLHKTVANPQIKLGSELKKADAGVWITLSRLYYLVEIKEESIKFYDCSQTGKDKLDNPNTRADSYSSEAYKKVYGEHNHNCFQLLDLTKQKEAKSKLVLQPSGATYNFDIIDKSNYAGQIQVNKFITRSGDYVGTVKYVNGSNIVFVRDATRPITLNSGDIITFAECDTDFAFFHRSGQLVNQITHTILYLLPIGKSTRRE